MTITIGTTLEGPSTQVNADTDTFQCGTGAGRRGWYPHESKGSRVEPTTWELLAMADGRRHDWRHREPTDVEIHAAERVLARHADITAQRLRSIATDIAEGLLTELSTELGGTQARSEFVQQHIAAAREATRLREGCLTGTESYRRLTDEIADHYDAIGHLVTEY